MKLGSIVVGETRLADLLNRIFKVCEREDLRAVFPGKETQKELLVAHQVEMLQWVTDFPACLTEYALRNDPRLHGKRVFTYSLDNNAADYTAHGLHRTPEGFSAFEVVGMGCIGRVRLRSLPEGEEAVLLAAVSAAVVCGVPFAQVLSALQHLL